MSDTVPKPFVFVLMPFKEEFDDVYKLGIKKACDNAGSYAERLDDQIFQDSILQRVYNQIAKADVIVADMTGRNPNVFYETGYAHALGKHVILLTKNTDDIPFDLKHYPHIIYKGRITDLIPKLEKRVKWAIENPEKPSDSEQPPIEFCVCGMPLFKNPIFEIEDQKSSVINDVRLRFDAHNQDNTRIQVTSFQVAILTSEKFCASYTSGGQHFEGIPLPRDGIQLPKGGIIHMRDKLFSILPGAWESFEWHLYTTKHTLLRPGDEEQITLRMFSDQGGYDYPFKVKIVGTKKKAAK